MKPSSRTWVEVSRSALLHNLREFQRVVGRQAQIAPVIKANAYGHGMAWVAKTLAKQQIWGFGVAYDTEALELRAQNVSKPLLVLSAWHEANLTALIRHDVRLVVWDQRSIRAIAETARRLRRVARIHVKVDTGTTRIGFFPSDAPALARVIQRQRWLELEGIFSHYADSEGEQLGFAAQQRSRLLAAARQLPAPLVHMACTAASLRLVLRGTNLVRLGLGLYGLWPSVATARTRAVQLQPVLTWKTRLLQTKRVPKGTTVGYDRTFRTTRATTIGVLPVGYADGFDRRASNCSAVVIGRSVAPVVGRVSMNLLTVDLGPRPAARTGETVTLIGSTRPADTLAAEWQTINYEVVSRIHSGIPRVEVT